MNNGIKPTRLWHLTGRKHFQKWLDDRLSASGGREQRDKYEFLKMYGLVMASAMCVFYSYGWFSPEKYLSTIIRSYTYDDSPKKCGVSEVPEPCPQDKKEDTKKTVTKPCSK